MSRYRYRFDQTGGKRRFRGEEAAPLELCFTTRDCDYLSLRVDRAAMCEATDFVNVPGFPNRILLPGRMYSEQAVDHFLFLVHRRAYDAAFEVVFPDEHHYTDLALLADHAGNPDLCAHVDALWAAHGGDAWLSTASRLAKRFPTALDAACARCIRMPMREWMRMLGTPEMHDVESGVLADIALARARIVSFYRDNPENYLDDADDACFMEYSKHPRMLTKAHRGTYARVATLHPGEYGRTECVPVDVGDAVAVRVYVRTLPQRAGVVTVELCMYFDTDPCLPPIFPAQGMFAARAVIQWNSGAETVLERAVPHVALTDADILELFGPAIKPESECELTPDRELTPEPELEDVFVVPPRGSNMPSWTFSVPEKPGDVLVSMTCAVKFELNLVGL